MQLLFTEGNLSTFAIVGKKNLADSTPIGSRVARFFLKQYTKLKKYTKLPLNYHKYTKWP
jgi:hypothetical protein